MTNSLAASWAELVGLVEQRAPRTHRGLRSPTGDVEQAQRRLGTSFTDELVEWFQTVGATSTARHAMLLPFNNVVDLDASVELTESTRLIWSDPPEEHLKDVHLAGTWAWTWLPEYVYVGVDGTGGGLFVDLRDGPDRGCVRWWDEAEADGGQQPLAHSVTDLVDMVVGAITLGTSIDGWTPVIDGGLLDWNVEGV